MLSRCLEINIDIPLRINHHRFPGGREHIGSVGQASQIKLLEVHDSRSARFQQNSSSLRQP